MRGLTAGVLVGAMAAGASFDASRAQERYVTFSAQRVERGGYDDYPLPHVVVRRRADFVIFSITGVCDTRDEAQRLSELRETLGAMIQAAGDDPEIELSRLETIAGEDPLVVPFEEESIEEGFRSTYQSRPDTTFVQLLIKTPINPDDTLQTAAGRIERFVEGLETVGRSEFVLADNETLSIVDPAQYRYEIIDAIAADANRIAATLGEGYAARFEGLEQEVSWYRSDVLELTLYIPHRMEVVPTPTEG